MRKAYLIAAAIAVGVPGGALACPPPPPGWVPPTHEQMLQRSLSGSTDIVYVVITKAAAAGEPAQFKILHVYRGSRKNGESIEAPVGWGHPTPVCVGMMGPAPPKAAGAYGVIAFAAYAPLLEFISPDDVQLMIRKGWIKSARVR